MTDEATTPPARGKRSLAIVAGLIVVIVIALGLWLASRPAPEQLQGMVDADEVNVGTKALARVERLIAEEGQRVRPGSLLATLSSPEIAGGQAQAQGALDAARRDRLRNQRGCPGGGYRDAARDVAGGAGGGGSGGSDQPTYRQPLCRGRGRRPAPR